MKENTINRKTKILIMIGLITGAMSPTFYSYARGIALPSVLADFNGMQYYAICSITAVLSMAVCTPIAGRLGTMFGRKRLFIGNSAVFFLSLIGCAAARSTGLYIFFIALSGATQGFISAYVNAIIADVMTEEERPKYVSYNSTVSTLIQLAGPLLSGVLIDQLNWRIMFLAGIPFPVISVILLMRFLPDLREESTGKQRIDVLGAIAFLGAVVPLLILLSFGGTMIPWASGVSLGLLAATVVFFILLVYIDTRHEAPMIPFYTFKNGAYLKLLAATFLFCLGMSMTSYLPYYLQNVLGTGAALSGTLITPRSIATVAATALVGTIMSKTGKYKEPLIFMLLLSIVSYAAMALLFTPDTSIAVIVITTVVNGLGNTAMIVVVITMCMQVLPRKDIGVGIALITFATSLAGSLGNAVGGLLTNTAWAGTSVPAKLQAILTTEQLGRLSSVSILKDSEALAAMRSGLNADMKAAFDSMILSFRQALGHGVGNLFWVMAAGSLAALLLTMTVKLPKRQQK